MEIWQLLLNVFWWIVALYCLLLDVQQENYHCTTTIQMLDVLMNEGESFVCYILTFLNISKLHMHCNFLPNIMSLNTFVIRVNII